MFLPDKFLDKVASFGEVSMGVNKIALRLRDGQVVEDVLVAWGKEILHVAGKAVIHFQVDDIVDVYDRSG